MAADRTAVLVVPAAAALLLWPALWNGYPIVFADTGTYLSQAIHHYAGWDRPVFYSLFMQPLHMTITLWPVVAAQALLAAWILWLVCRTLVPNVSSPVFVGGIAALSACTWFSWTVSELMPDLFTPLLVLLVCLLAWTPERLSQREQAVSVGLAALMIAAQQSSLPLACVLLAMLAGLSAMLGGPSAIRRAAGRPDQARFMTADHRPGGHASRRWLLIILPPMLAVLGLCTANLAAHGRFAMSPYGNVFLLARVIYDGPGMAVLRRDCPERHWRLCPFLDNFPATSDDFLWTPESPLNRAGGPKAVSQDASDIVTAALIADPAGEARAALTNLRDQLRRFDSGDGLIAWPMQVSPWIERDFPARERASYMSARQQRGQLSVPVWLARIHHAVALGGVIGCVLLLPSAMKRRSACAGFLLAVLLSLAVNAAITGCLSAPHERYQSRIMWLPAFVAVISALSLQVVPHPRKYVTS